MSTDNETLLLAVLSQLPVTKLNYTLLASQINSPTPGAAAKKWQRFQKKLRDAVPGNTSPRNNTSPVVAGKKPVGVVKGKGKGKVVEMRTPSPPSPPSSVVRRCPPRKSRVERFMDGGSSEEEGDEVEGGDGKVEESVEVEDGEGFDDGDGDETEEDF